MKLRQFELQDLTGAILVCWLEDDARLKLRTVLTLEETGKRIWRIERRYRAIDSSGINRRWRVGGLE